MSNHENYNVRDGFVGMVFGAVIIISAFIMGDIIKFDMLWGIVVCSMYLLWRIT
jgi:hypothetical protein